MTPYVWDAAGLSDWIESLRGLPDAIQKRTEDAAGLFLAASFAGGFLGAALTLALLRGTAGKRAR